MMTISGLYIYPIKSLGGVEVTSARVTDRGLEHDRRWMLVDHNNRFLTQRQYPEMALLKVRVNVNGLTVGHGSRPEDEIQIPFEPESTETGRFAIWDEVCDGQFVGHHYDEWFTMLLRCSCRLVYMPELSQRAVDPQYVSTSKITSFADAYPFLMIGEASLNDLNFRLDEAVPMDRFRPNIVFTGGKPYQEDKMAHFKIAGIDFYGVKLCARCPIPGIDQQTALRGKEPVKTLANYRSWNNKVYFGQNLVHRGEGTIKLGDQIKVIEIKEMPNALLII